MTSDSSACIQWNNQHKFLSERTTPPPWPRETGPGPSAPKYGGMCPIPTDLSIMQQELNKKQYLTNNNPNTYTMSKREKYARLAKGLNVNGSIQKCLTRN